MSLRMGKKSRFHDLFSTVGYWALGTWLVSIGAMFFAFVHWLKDVETVRQLVGISIIVILITWGTLVLSPIYFVLPASILGVLLFLAVKRVVTIRHPIPQAVVACLCGGIAGAFMMTLPFSIVQAIPAGFIAGATGGCTAIIKPKRNAIYWYTLIVSSSIAGAIAVFNG